MSELAIPDRGTPISAGQLVEIERQTAAQLAQITDHSTLEEGRRRARALEQYLTDKEMQGPMRGVQRRIEARIGELLGEPKVGSHHSVTTEGGEVDKDARSDFRVLQHARNGLELTDDEWRKSRRALVSLIRNRMGLVPDTPPLPEGTFRCIVADPPWRLDTGPDNFNTVSERGHDALAYEQMSVEQIKELPVLERVAPDAHLYLWTTNRYVEAAYQVTRAWGFTPSVLLVWAKTPRGVGLGDAYRLTTEFVLYARRGSLREREITPTTWFDWPRGKHSVKPENFYKLVEMVSPAADGERLELFARRARKGWETWGAEAPE